MEKSQGVLVDFSNGVDNVRRFSWFYSVQTKLLALAGQIFKEYMEAFISSVEGLDATQLRHDVPLAIPSELTQLLVELNG